MAASRWSGRAGRNTSRRGCARGVGGNRLDRPLDAVDRRVRWTPLRRALSQWGSRLVCEHRIRGSDTQWSYAAGWDRAARAAVRLGARSSASDACPLDARGFGRVVQSGGGSISPFYLDTAVVTNRQLHGSPKLADDQQGPCSWDVPVGFDHVENSCFVFMRNQRVNDGRSAVRCPSWMTSSHRNQQSCPNSM
jgi:hypothetical protein